MSNTALTKTQKQKLWSALVAKARLNMEFAPGSAEHDFLLLVTAELPIVYSELPSPRFCVISIPGHRGSYRCVHVFKTNKWIPLTATKVFATKGITNTSNKKKRVLAAMRACIKPQIDNYKAQIIYPVTCPLSGKILRDGNGKRAHVDHKWPFSRLVQQWLDLENLTFEEIELNRAGEFKDRSLQVKWYNYHNAEAVLQLVDKEHNLKKGART